MDDFIFNLHSKNAYKVERWHWKKFCTAVLPCYCIHLLLAKKEGAGADLLRKGSIYLINYSNGMRLCTDTI